MQTRKLGFIALLPMLVAAASIASAAQVQSTMSQGVGAVMQAGGFYLQPVGIAPQSYGDLAPAQMFEIVRPGNQSVTIGRLFTSCSCVNLEADQRSFAPGQPAVLRLRNVRATPPNGQNYAIYVQITSPIRTTLRFDTFVQSSQFIPAPAGMPPTRGNIVSDGIYTGQVSSPNSSGGIEIIVPRADTTYMAELQKKQDAAASGVLDMDDTVAKAEAALAKAVAAEKAEAEALAKASEEASSDIVAKAEAALAKAVAAEKAKAEALAKASEEASSDTVAKAEAALAKAVAAEKAKAEAAASLSAASGSPEKARDEIAKQGKAMLEEGETPAAVAVTEAVAESVVAAKSGAAPETADSESAAEEETETAKLVREVKDKAEAAQEKVAEAASDAWQELKVKSASLREEIGETVENAVEAVKEAVQK